MLPLIPPNLQPSNGNNQFTYGVSFASAGAGALAGTFPGMVNIISFFFSNLFGFSINIVLVVTVTIIIFHANKRLFSQNN